MQHWEKEMFVQARKYHLLACIVLCSGFLFFTLADYAGQTYENWLNFLFWRLVIVGSLLPMAWLTHRKKLHPYFLAYAFTLSMSFFIIYTQIKSPLEQIGGISLALTIFYLTTGFSVLWHWKHTFFVACIVVLVNLAVAIPHFGAQVFFKNSGIWNIIVPFSITGLVAYRFAFIKNEILLRLNLLEKNEEINQQKEELQTQNQQIEQQSQELQTAYSQITDSVRYATRIQKALLPKKENLELLGKDRFVLYRAKDGISGDFYWLSSVVSNTEKNAPPTTFLAVADCTGHGVAGGLMTMLGHSLLSQLILNEHFTEPAEILTQLDLRLLQLLQQKQDQEKSKHSKVADGMDITIIKFADQILPLDITYAAAKRKIWHFSGNTFQEYAGNPYPIGDSFFQKKHFTQSTFTVKENDLIYLFTDGYADQFGENGKKFMIRNFRNLLKTIHPNPLADQAQTLAQTMKNWQGETDQTDDWLVVGIRF